MFETNITEHIQTSLKNPTIRFCLKLMACFLFFAFQARLFILLEISDMSAKLSFPPNRWEKQSSINKMLLLIIDKNSIYSKKSNHFFINTYFQIVIVKLYLKFDSRWQNICADPSRATRSSIEGKNSSSQQSKI
jgi:hypothetical protein